MQVCCQFVLTPVCWVSQPLSATTGTACPLLLHISYGATLRPEDLHELAKGFAAVAPVRVLWALKDSALRPGIDKSDLPLGSNTLVVPWVDYNVRNVKVAGRGVCVGGREKV